jgi:hypothetical protein
MIETGILQEGEPYELINGEILRKTDYQSYPFPKLNQAIPVPGGLANEMGIGKRHAAATKRLNFVLSNRLGDSAIVSVRDPVQLNEYNEPQPDIAILKFSPDFYLTDHPKPSDIYLLVEVSDTTLTLDRTVKLPVYAEAEMLRSGSSTYKTIKLKFTAIHPASCINPFKSSPKAKR